MNYKTEINTYKRGNRLTINNNEYVLNAEAWYANDNYFMMVHTEERGPGNQLLYFKKYYLKFDNNYNFVEVFK